MKIFKVIISTICIGIGLFVLLQVVDMSYIIAKWEQQKGTDYVIDLSELGEEDHIDPNELGPIQLLPDKELKSDTSIINVLLIGDDGEGRGQGENSRGGSDSMMIATIDMKHHKLKLTSLMRDCYVEVPGTDKKGKSIGARKLNVAYTIGGATLLLDTLEHNFKIKIDNYAVINFKVFREVIDYIGGVDINLSSQEALYLRGRNEVNSSERRNIKEGVNNLKGQAALEYARARGKNQKGNYIGSFTYIDENGEKSKPLSDDFARTARQRYLLETLYKQMKDQGLLTLKGIASRFIDNIWTNISLNDLISYMEKALYIGTEKIEQLQIPLKNAYEDKKVGSSGAQVLYMNGENFEKNINGLRSFIYED